MHIIVYIKSHYRRLCRAIAFGKKAYSGYDWDYSHSIDIFKFSLERLSKNLDNDSAQRINMVCKLMDKVQKGDYEYEHYEEMEKIYGQSEMKTKDIGNGMYEYIGLTWEKAIDEDHNNKINNELTERHYVSYKKQERADVLMWKLIQHNIKNWWN